MNSTNIPNQNGLGFFWNDSGLSSGNLCTITNWTTATAHLNGLAASTYKTGAPSEFSATIQAVTVPACTVSELIWMRGRHAVIVSKLSRSSGTSTVANYGFASPPVPLAQGATLGSTATDTTSAYGEQPTGQQSNPISSVFGQGLTANMTGSGIPRVNTAFIATEANQQNRDWYGGRGVDFNQTLGVSFTSAAPVYAAADFAFGFGSLTPATEKARIGSWTLTGDVATFTYDPSGTPEVVYLALTGQSLSGTAIGSYGVTGSNVLTFTGKSAAADWWGGSDLTLVTFGAVNQGALATAGNLSVQKVSGATTRVWSSGSNTTIYSAALPTGSTWTVNAYLWDGTTTDVSGSCTITGSSVLIPSAIVSTYAYGGLAMFDIGQVASLPPSSGSVLMMMM
jgi:hypothetical protein